MTVRIPYFSFLFVLGTLLLAAPSARADFELNCPAKRVSAAEEKRCVNGTTAIARKIGCDVIAVECLAGGMGYLCTVQSLNCEGWVDRPLPETPKLPAPTEPEVKPSSKPAPKPDSDEIGSDDDELDEIPTRRTQDENESEDDGFNPRSSGKKPAESKKTEAKKTEPKPAPVVIREEPVNPNRGCRTGYAKVSGAAMKGPETFCRADSFDRPAYLGACAMKWQREARELFVCSDCVTPLGQLRCETDAKNHLKSVNKGCASVTAAAKSTAEIEIQCLGAGTPDPRPL